MTAAFAVRAAAEGDLPAVLRLNALEVQATSALDSARLARLHAQAALHDVAVAGGSVVAFLLVLPQGCDYDSPNYRWFTQRYDAFWYVDRIVVDPQARGWGIGAAMYRRLIERARAAGVPRLTCEYNIEPPNAASDAFHRRFGFSEVGRQRLDAGLKCVALCALPLADGR